MQPNSQYPQHYPQLQAPQYNQQYPPQYPMQYQQYQQYPQQPGMYQQPQVIATAVSQNYIPVPSKEILIGAGGRQEGNVVTRGGFQKLDQQTGIFIKQKMELAELVLGCETQNKYNVYSLDLQGTKKGRQIFKAKEKSDFCARYCLSGDCRPFEMNVSTTVRGEEDDEYEPFLHLERPCKCTCLCFNRPEIKVTAVEGGQSQYIGKIIDPWNFCNLQMDVYDKDHNLRYVVEGSCCQLGIWCKCPCDPCQTLDFDVKTPSGEIVSTLQKRTPGCLQALTTDMDSFALQFPKNCTTQDKALLMAAVLFLDYRHFEQNPRDRNHQNY